MNDDIVNFLDKHRIGVASMMIQGNVIHSAVMHYTYTKDPFNFYFSTNIYSRKASAIKEGATVKGSLVIGFSESEWCTMQLDGDMVGIHEKEEIKKTQEIYLSRPFHGDPSTLMIRFTPTWWRFTDLTVSPSVRIEWPHSSKAE